jgi:mgtE-like transporter
MTVYDAKKIIKESAPLLTLCVAIGIIGGQMLNSYEDILIAIPTLLMIVPVINGIGGNIGSILGARIASGMHMGIIDADLHGKELKRNVISALILGIISYTSLALFVMLIAPFVGISVDSEFLPKIGLIMIGAGLMLTIVLTVATLIFARLSFKRGLDPDNIITPIVTTLGDLLGIICLMIMIGIVGVSA